MQDEIKVHKMEKWLDEEKKILWLATQTIFLVIFFEPHKDMIGTTWK